MGLAREAGGRAAIVGSILSVIGAIIPPLAFLVPIGIGIAAAGSIAVALDQPKPDTDDNTKRRHHGFGQYRNPVGTVEVVPVVYGRHRYAPEFLQAYVSPRDTLNANWKAKNQGVLGHKDQSLNLFCGCGEGPYPHGWLEQIQINGQDLWETHAGARVGTGDGTKTVFDIDGRWLDMDSVEVFVDGVQWTGYDTATLKTVTRKIGTGNGSATSVTWTDSTPGVKINFDSIVWSYRKSYWAARGTFVPSNFTVTVTPISDRKFKVTVKTTNKRFANGALPAGIELWATYSYMSIKDGVNVVQSALGFTTARFSAAPGNGLAITMNGKQSNFPNVTVESRRGEVNQTPYEGMNEIRNSYSVGDELDKGSSVIYTTTIAVDNVSLIVSAARGIINRWSTAGGAKDSGANVEIQIDYRKNGESLWDTLVNADTGKSSFDLSGWDDDPKSWQINVRDHIKRSVSNGHVGKKRLEDFTRSVYQIRVTRVSNVRTGSSGSQDTIWWTLVDEIIEEQLSYPGLASFWIRAIATEKVQGSVPQITATIKGREVVDVTSGVLAWSQDPASCAVDFLKNARFGPGVPASEIVTASWQTLKAWCAGDRQIKGGAGNTKTEARSLCDVVIDTAKDPLTQVSEMIAPSLAAPIKRGKLWDVWIDNARATDKIYYYSGAVSNEVESSMKASIDPLSRAPTELLVSFNDLDEKYETIEMLIPPATRARNKVRQSVAFYSCVRKSQAAWAGAHVMRSIELMPRAIEFVAMPDGALSSAGDVIDVRSEIEGATSGKKWRVVRVSFDFDLRVRLLCREYSDAFFAMDPRAITVLPNNTDLPTTQTAKQSGSIAGVKPVVTYKELRADVYA